MKGREPIAALTAYDYPMTRLLDECAVPLLLVGDSLGMVVLGYPDTTHVTMAEMEHHVRACARARPNGLLAADLPYHSYETPDEAVAKPRHFNPGYWPTIQLLALVANSQPARYVPRIILSASGAPVARIAAASHSTGFRSRCASTPTSVISVSRAPYAKLLLAASPPLHASIQSR